MSFNLPKLLSPIKVKLSDLLLDPNNPRFSELGESLSPVAENRYADDKVQSNTFEKMRHQSFDVGELRDTIKTLGFLPMDRVVVRKWRGVPSDARDKFVVIEGNRRVTALKWLVNLHDIGKETFAAEQLENFTEVECLQLDDSIAPASALLILPGLRHVSGVKEWGPYQKAKAVHALREGGLSPQETAQSFGLSTLAANRAYRCFLALEQMKRDEEFGEFAEPKMYSFFEEIFKRPVIKNWLGWSDETDLFTDQDRLHEFYSWIVPGVEDASPPKLPEAKSVRDLALIIEDDSAMGILRSQEGSLARALARYEVEHPEDWFPKITAAMAALKSLTPDALRKLDTATIDSLNVLEARIQQVLRDKDLLSAQD